MVKEGRKSDNKKSKSVIKSTKERHSIMKIKVKDYPTGTLLLKVS